MKISHMNIIPKNFFIVGKSQIKIKLGGFEYALMPPLNYALFLYPQAMNEYQQFKPPEYFLLG